ncbi:MAG: hypothetical protein LBD30_06095 [Verrucomicrobiales bacterium]|nr:hypothetical protein [Verrucomicrobiales bacterium]
MMQPYSLSAIIGTILSATGTIMTVLMMVTIVRPVGDNLITAIGLLLAAIVFFIISWIRHPDRKTGKIGVIASVSVLLGIVCVVLWFLMFAFHGLH